MDGSTYRQLANDLDRAIRFAFALMVIAFSVPLAILGLVTLIVLAVRWTGLT